MRNLKKVLALTLAIALVLSLSVTAGAVSFTDEDTITAKYQDAVDLMSELSIMNGFPDNTYQPQGDLTRAQYLKMLYVVMNRGVDDQAVLYTDVQPFPFYDVRSSDWFNGYVKWGYGRQLIDGYGGGIFKPNGTVTGFEALKMSLTALGYSSEIEGYTGDAWKTQVLNDAQDAGLLTDLETANLSAVLSREAAAQMLHNTLFAQMVNYNTTYIPAKMEKGQTMAYNYYNLFILRGVVVSNEWASVTSRAKDLVGETTIYVDASNIPRDVEGKAIGSTTGDFFTLPNYKAPVELLGHEVVVYARYANNYTTRPFDKVYGEMVKTDRSKETVKYAREDVTGSLNTNGSAAANNISLGYYVTNGDYGMDATFANVISSGTRLVVDYTVKGHSDSVSLKQGSPIKFIDNDNNGVYDFIIASNMTYAKVTNVADDGKVTAFAGVKADGDFTGTAVLSSKAAADIYLGYNEAQTEISEALKVDDRVLVYDLPGSKKGIIPVKAINGTLTSTNGNVSDSARATISGTTYRNWLFDSAIDDLEGTAKGANFDVAKDWRFFGTYLLEGPAISSASKQWALVLDSYASGNSNFNSFVKQVQVLLADGTTGVYTLSAIYDTDGKNGRDFDIDNSGGANKLRVYKTSASVNYTLNDILENVALNSYNMFQAVVSDDGASITLYEPKSTEAAMGATSYTNGQSSLTTSGGTKNVLNNTAFFVVNPTSDNAGVYIGRKLPTFTGGVAGSRAVYADIDGSQNSSGSYVRAAVLLTDKIDVVTHSGNYALVVSTPKVFLDSASGKYYATIEAFNGTETKTYTTVNGLRANDISFGNYKTSDISTVRTSLSSIGDLNVGNGNVIEFDLNAEGKINALVRIGDTTSANTATGGDGVYRGYYVTGGTGWVTYWGDKAAASLGTLAQDVDAEFYNMTGTVGVKASSWPNATNAHARWARMLVVKGEVIRVWVDTTNAGWNTGSTTTTTTTVSGTPYYPIAVDGSGNPLVLATANLSSAIDVTTELSATDRAKINLVAQATETPLSDSANVGYFFDNGALTTNLTLKASTSFKAPLATYTMVLYDNVAANLTVGTGTGAGTFQAVRVIDGGTNANPTILVEYGGVILNGISVDSNAQAGTITVGSSNGTGTTGSINVAGTSGHIVVDYAATVTSIISAGTVGNVTIGGNTGATVGVITLNSAGAVQTNIGAITGAITLSGTVTSLSIVNTHATGIASIASTGVITSGVSMTTGKVGNITLSGTNGPVALTAGTIGDLTLSGTTGAVQIGTAGGVMNTGAVTLSGTVASLVVNTTGAVASLNTTAIINTHGATVPVTFTAGTITNASVLGGTITANGAGAVSVAAGTTFGNTLNISGNITSYGAAATVNLSGTYTGKLTVSGTLTQTQNSQAALLITTGDYKAGIDVTGTLIANANAAARPITITNLTLAANQTLTISSAATLTGNGANPTLLVTNNSGTGALTLAIQKTGVNVTTGTAALGAKVIVNLAGLTTPTDTFVFTAGNANSVVGLVGLGTLTDQVTTDATSNVVLNASWGVVLTGGTNTFTVAGTGTTLEVVTNANVATFTRT